MRAYSHHAGRIFFIAFLKLHHFSNIQRCGVSGLDWMFPKRENWVERDSFLLQKRKARPTGCPPEWRISKARHMVGTWKYSWNEWMNGWVNKWINVHWGRRKLKQIYSRLVFFFLKLAFKKFHKYNVNPFLTLWKSRRRQSFYMAPFPEGPLLSLWHPPFKPASPHFYTHSWDFYVAVSIYNYISTCF